MLANDTELLRLVGLSEQLAAGLLNKSRQTLNIGLKRANAYFRTDELARLIAHCASAQPTSLETVKQYVRDSRDPMEAAEALQFAALLTARSVFLTAEAISAAKEAWITLPDFRYFKTTHPDILATLRERARRAPATFGIVVGVQEDADQFWDYAGLPRNKKRTLKDSRVDAWPYTLFLEPNSNAPTGWALGTHGFQMIHAMRIDCMLSSLASEAAKNGNSSLFTDANAGVEVE